MLHDPEMRAQHQIDSDIMSEMTNEQLDDFEGDVRERHLQMALYSLNQVERNRICDEVINGRKYKFHA